MSDRQCSALPSEGILRVWNVTGSKRSASHCWICQTGISFHFLFESSPVWVSSSSESMWSCLSQVLSDFFCFVLFCYTYWGWMLNFITITLFTTEKQHTFIGLFTVKCAFTREFSFLNKWYFIWIIHGGIQLHEHIAHTVLWTVLWASGHNNVTSFIAVDRRDFFDTSVHISFLQNILEC